MDKKILQKVLLYFTIGYLFLFTVMALVKRNYEFLWYTFMMSVVIFIIVLNNKKMHLPKTVMIGLTVIGAMHIFGGNIYLDGTRLYDMWLLPFFRYDNLIHSLGAFMATFFAYSLLAPYIDDKLKYHGFYLSLLLVFVASGMGAFVEITEFIAVGFLGASKAVGDYFNNAWDLVFNVIGSMVACIFIVNYHKHRRN